METDRKNDEADSALFDPNDSLILLLDHQAGLLQTVKDRRFGSR